LPVQLLHARCTDLKAKLRAVMLLLLMFTF
jgi:hypothetical protein